MSTIKKWFEALTHKSSGVSSSSSSASTAPVTTKPETEKTAAGAVGATSSTNASSAAAIAAAAATQKRAFIIGINYLDSDNQLKGCINDALGVYNMLTTHYGYSPINVLLLTDDTGFKPTRDNILEGLKWFLSSSPASEFAGKGKGSIDGSSGSATPGLSGTDGTKPPGARSAVEAVAMAEAEARATAATKKGKKGKKATAAAAKKEYAKLIPGTTLYFHYSGHGDRELKGEGSGEDEEDGRDEFIVPSDSEKAGVILDDTLRSELVNKVPSTCRLFATVDACSSGTSFDLRWILGPWKAKDQYSVREQKKCAQTSAQVLMLSGCADDKSSFDARDRRDYYGALTLSMLQVLDDANYAPMQAAELVDRVRQYIYDHDYVKQVPCLSFGRVADFTAGWQI